MTRRDASERLRARIKRAQLHLTGSHLNRYDVDEIGTALKLLDEIRSYGPAARLRINATGSHKFNIYDPTKSAKGQRS